MVRPASLTRAACVALALLATGFAGSLTGCRSTPEEPVDEAEERYAPGHSKSEQLTIEQFRELIHKGALRPIEAMPDDSRDFQDPAPNAAPFDQTAKALEEALRQKTDAGVTPAAPGASEAAPTAPVAAPPPEPENPYLVFGKRIVVYDTRGLISKPFPLRVGLGKQLKLMLDQSGNFPLYDPASGPQKPDTVRIDLLEKWDQELFTDLRATGPYEGTPQNVADWLVVTSGFELLREVQDFIDIFAGGVPQVEIEAKIVEVTVNDSLDLGVKPIDATTPIFGFPDHTFLKSFTYTLPNQASSTASNSLLTLGGVTDGMAFNIALQALATYENVSIISRPKIAVREGGRAEIVNTLKLPNYNVNQINAAGQAQAALSYEEVGIKLFVVPRVIGTQTVALNIDVEASAQSGSSVSFVLQNGQAISNPIISRRAAKTVVYLEPGQAVILGGLISERLVDSENSIPVLGDIPILGYLFKSTFKRKEQTNVLFFIRPRILQGSDLNREFGD
jgi:type II secretory pathway component GspD/PulD (secretin)